MVSDTAPLLRHPPVNRLHSIAEKANTVAHFSLTARTEGVQKDRSLTASEVFPVGTASGAQAKSAFRAARCWSRRTGRFVEGKIESRGVKLVYPVGGEPGARTKIARRDPQGEGREQV